MTKLIIMKWILIIGVVLFLVLSCNSSSNDFTWSSSGVYLVRVVNARTDTITVVIGPANYGAIAPNDTTDYKEVNEGENIVWLNGQVFQGSPARFGTGISNTCRWTYVFDASWHYDWDDCN